ncbi:hypothetical protein ACQ4WY_10000 [Janthinobacterium sp. LB2P49]|uniref:hypothetical protein n=1 Tax=Janthinobacterium sp. LB2P49 TaxID=3424198 RepID=UPI003F2379CD
MEDEPDKLRRNTVVLSSIVMVVGYLNLKFPENLLGFGIPAGSDHKVWVLLLIVSIYCMLRFHFSGDSITMRISFRHKMRSLPTEKRYKLVIFAAHFRRLFFRIPCSYNAATSFLANEVDRNLEVFELKKIHNIHVGPSYEISTNPREQRMDIAFSYVDRIHGLHHYSFKNNLQLSRFVLFSARLFAGLDLLMSPKNVVDLFVPYVMFISAFIVLIMRIKGWW